MPAQFNLNSLLLPVVGRLISRLQTDIFIRRLRANGCGRAPELEADYTGWRVLSSEFPKFTDLGWCPGLA